MTIFDQFKINGILYTMKAVPTAEFPSKEIPYADHIKAQFRDIAENHAILSLEQVERPAVLATAAEQVREYNGIMAGNEHITRLEIMRSKTNRND